MADSMDAEILIVLTIMGLTVIFLVTEIIRIDVTALLAMLALSWTGILSTSEALSGFSSNAVVAMIAVMIMGEGISRTGIMSRFSKAVLRKVGTGKTGILGVFSLSVGTLSGVIQNIGAAALFLPSILDISRRIKISASELIMPIGFAAIIGGTLTMVGSGHLILTNDLLQNADLEPYGLFAVTPVGIALLLAAILFFLLFGKFVLPQGSGEARQELTEQEKLIDAFSLSQNIRYFRIPGESPLIGKTVEESGVWRDYALNILALSHDQYADYAPWRETRFEQDQTLALYGDDERIKEFVSVHKLEPASDHHMFHSLDDPDESGFVEVVVPPRSELVGQTIRKFSMRKRYAVEPLMIFSQGRKIQGDISDHEIQPGDTFIIYGPWPHIRDLQNSDPFVVVTPFEVAPRDRSGTVPAVGSFLLAIGLAMSGFSISIAFLTGAIAMVLSRVMTIQDAYKAIEWKVVFLLVGLIPLGVAMQNSGAAEFLARNVMIVVEGSHIYLLLLTVALLSTIFSLVMSNVGAVVVLAPLVVSIGTLAGVDPRPLVLLAAVSAGNSFVLPTHQVNALLMTAGGYRTSDYFKAGGGMTIVFLFVAVTFFYFTFF
ncbi:SLC13 family permease [Balneolales bacterium ANBcel1]|nr:SLC13 family permease [Balneolales bacterium ANBcel1]